MGRARDLARHTLLHLNVLLAVFAGGVLATTARLCWDPSLYLVVRELWPLEYRAVLAALPAAGLSQLVLAHLGVTATRQRRATCLLWTYAASMASLLASLMGAAWWAWRRWQGWSASPEAARARRLAQLPAQLRPALATLAEWVPHTDTVRDLLQEAEADLPKNGYVALAAAVLYAAAAVAAATLAVTLAYSRGQRKYRGLYRTHSTQRTIVTVRTLPDP